MRKTKTMEGYCWLCKSLIATCCKGKQRIVIALAAMFLVKSSGFKAVALAGPLVNWCAEKEEVRNIFLNLVNQVANPHVMGCHRAATWWCDIGSGIYKATTPAKSILSIISAMSTTSSESATLSTRSNMSTTRQVNEVHDVDSVHLVHLWAISWAMSSAHWALLKCSC